MASVYSRQLQNIVKDFRLSGRPWPASARAIAEWAITNKMWAMRDADIINRCADEIARAMREEYYIDPQGRKVRAKHAAKVAVDGEQATFWDDIRSADRNFMAIALQQRRQQIVGDCRQLKTDADSYNDNKNPGASINIVFDFTYDVEEGESAA
jgi:hypothetical protein